MLRENMHKFAKISPTTVSSFEDLIRYGKMHAYEFNEEIEGKDFIELLTINPKELKSIRQGDEAWTYYINKYNFRDEWTFDKNKPNIGFFGCSFTFGEGIKSKNTFVQIVTKKLNANGFNFGVGGAGVERVARTISAATKVIDFDYIVVTLPMPTRELYYTKHMELANIVHSYIEKDYEDLGKALAILPDEYYYHKAIGHISWIHDICLNKNIKLILSSWDHPLNELCTHLLPNNTLAPFPNIDDKKARDMQHPGVKSQKAHAVQIIEAMNDTTRF